MKHALGEQERKLSLLELACAGAGSGVFVAFVLTPVELIKCRCVAFIGSCLQFFSGFPISLLCKFICLFLSLLNALKCAQTPDPAVCWCGEGALHVPDGCGGQNSAVSPMRFFHFFTQECRSHSSI